MKILIGIVLFIIFCMFLSEITTPKLSKGDISDDELNNFGLDIETNVINDNSINIVGIDISKKTFFDSEKKYIKLDGVSKSYYKMKEMIDLTKVTQVELIQDNDIITKVSSGSAISRAVVGGALAGGIGAVVGGNTAKSKSSNKLMKISFRFKINDMNNPYKEIVIVYNKDGIANFRKEEAWKLFGQIELVLESLKNTDNNENVELESDDSQLQIPKKRNANKQKRNEETK